MEDPAAQVTSGGAASQGQDAEATSNAVDASAPEVQDAIRQAVEAATKDFKKKVDEFRHNNIQLSQQLKEWQSLGMDQEHLKTMVQNVSKNEEARLAAEGKFDELLALRTEPMRKDYETKLTAAHERAQEFETKVKDFEQKVFELQISNQVASAARSNPDVQDDAVPLIVDMAGKVWRVEGDGEYVPRRPNGARWIGKDGKSDIKFSEWIEGLKETFPSLFKSPTGPGGRGGPGRINSVDLSKMSPAARIEWARANGRT